MRETFEEEGEECGDSVQYERVIKERGRGQEELRNICTVKEKKYLYIFYTTSSGCAIEVCIKKKKKFVHF